MSVEAFLKAAASEVGRTESPAGSNRQPYAAEAGHLNGYPWCATFIVAMARRADVVLPSESAYTPTMANGFRSIGRWHTTNPQPGDLVFFDFPDSKNRIQHVGIVEKVGQGGWIQTIEGNTSSGDGGSQDNGGGVYRRQRRGYIVGYGRPQFPTPVQEDFPVLIRKGTGNRVYHLVGGTHLYPIPSAELAELLAGKDWRDKVRSIPSGHTVWSRAKIVKE